MLNYKELKEIREFLKDYKHMLIRQRLLPVTQINIGWIVKRIDEEIKNYDTDKLLKEL